MKLKKGDTILITAGKDRGKKGKILQVFPKESRILVEGVNLRKKHQKARRSGEKGQIVEIPGPVDSSNAKLICSKCGQATRIGYKITAKEDKSRTKFRICKKCEKEV